MKVEVSVVMLVEGPCLFIGCDDKIILLFDRLLVFVLLLMFCGVGSNEWRYS